MQKVNVRVCDMQPKELEHITSDMSSWRTLFKEQVSVFERRRIQSLKDSGQIVKSEQGERFRLPFPFPSLPFPFSLPLPSPPLPFPSPPLTPLEVGPLNPARGSGGAL